MDLSGNWAIIPLSLTDWGWEGMVGCSEMTSSTVQTFRSLGVDRGKGSNSRTVSRCSQRKLPGKNNPATLSVVLADRSVAVAEFWTCWSPRAIVLLQEERIKALMVSSWVAESSSTDKFWSRVAGAASEVIVFWRWLLSSGWVEAWYRAWMVQVVPRVRFLRKSSCLGFSGKCSFLSYKVASECPVPC